MNNWKPITADEPPNDVVVETKIDDSFGERNKQNLVRRNRLWFAHDMSIYVYYTPTHWREALSAPRPK